MSEPQTPLNPDIKNPQLLAAFYNAVTQEVSRLRDERWRLSYYFIAEATGAILAIADGRLDKFVNSFVLVIVLLVQISCIGFWVWYMYVNHEYLSIARNTRRRLERYFGLHDLKVVDEAIVPEAWRPHAIYKYFEVHSILLPLGIFVVSIQLASIYVALKMLFGEVGLPR